MIILITDQPLLPPTGEQCRGQLVVLEPLEQRR